MLKKRLYGPPFLLLWLFVKGFRYGFISNGRNRLANQGLVPGVDCGTVGWASTWVVGCVPLAGKRLGCAGGGVSSMAVEISSVTSRVAFLNSLMPVPKPLASYGSFLAPNRIRTTANIRMISQPPSIPANITFIYQQMLSHNLSPGAPGVKHQKDPPRLPTYGGATSSGQAAGQTWMAKCAATVSGNYPVSVRKSLGPSRGRRVPSERSWPATARRRWPPPLPAQAQGCVVLKGSPV